MSIRMERRLRDDLMREIYVREAVERGLADSKEGRTKDVREIRAKYGLPE
jgi:predicted transcriptional regulator